VLCILAFTCHLEINIQTLLDLKSQADHSICSSLCETKRISEGYETAHLTDLDQTSLGLNIPIKLNETLIDSCMVFFSTSGPV